MLEKSIGVAEKTFDEKTAQFFSKDLSKDDSRY